MAVLLQSVEELRSKLAYGVGNDDVDEAIKSALEKATTTLEGSLRTPFAAGTATDTFMARKLSFGATGLQTVAKLKLSRGFVDTAQTITARAAATLAGLDDVDEYTDLRDNDGVDHLIVEDDEKGKIMIVDYSFLGIARGYVRISYTCGFSNDQADPPLYTGIPAWLETMAEIQAELHTMTNPVMNPGLDTASNKTIGEPARVKELRSALEVMLQDHCCYAPGYAKAWKRSFTAS